jgi:hypothetical protein
MSIKFLKAAGISFALIGAAALPLQAAAHDHAAPSDSTVASTDSQRVVRDPVTGQLRAPTADEHAVLEQQQANKARMFRVAPKANMQRYHPNGGRGARLTDEFLTSSVVVKAADGSLVEQCFDSHDAAEAAVHSHSVTTSSLKRETE